MNNPMLSSPCLAGEKEGIWTDMSGFNPFMTNLLYGVIPLPGEWEGGGLYIVQACMDLTFYD